MVVAVAKIDKPLDLTHAVEVTLGARPHSIATAPPRLASSDRWSGWEYKRYRQSGGYHPLYSVRWIHRVLSYCPPHVL